MKSIYSGIPRRHLQFAVILLFLMVDALAFPNQDFRITAFVTSVPQNSPLLITGFRLPTRVGDPPRVLLRNNSGKQIQRFALGVVSGSADRPGPVDAAATTERFPIVISDLALRKTEHLVPDATDEVSESALASGVLVPAAQRGHTTCLHVSIVVTELEFADGTKWKLEDFFEKAHKLWKDSIRPDSLTNCRNSSETEQAFNRMKGAKYVVGAPTRADASPVKQFSFYCTMGANEEHPVCQI